MTKKLAYYIIGAALTIGGGYVVILGIQQGGFAVFHTMCLLLGIGLMWKAHTIKIKQEKEVRNEGNRRNTGSTG